MRFSLKFLKATQTEHNNLEQVEWFCSQLKALNRCVDVFVSDKKTIQQWLVRAKEIQEEILKNNEL